MKILPLYAHELDRYAPELSESEQFRSHETILYQDAQQRALDAGEHQLADDIAKLDEANGEGYRAMRENDNVRLATLTARPAAKAEAMAMADEHAVRYRDLRREVSEGPNGRYRMMLAEAVVSGRDIDEVRQEIQEFDETAVEENSEARHDQESKAEEKARDQKIRASVVQMRGTTNRHSSKLDDRQTPSHEDRQRTLSERADEAKEAGRDDLERVFRDTARSENLERNANRADAEDLYAHRSLHDESLPSRADQCDQAHQALDDSETARDALARETPELRAEAEGYMTSDRRIMDTNERDHRGFDRSIGFDEDAYHDGVPAAETDSEEASSLDTRTEALRPRSFRVEQHEKAWDAKHVEKSSRFDGPPKRSEGQQATADAYHQGKSDTVAETQTDNRTEAVRPRAFRTDAHEQAWDAKHTQKGMRQ